MADGVAREAAQEVQRGNAVVDSFVIGTYLGALRCYTSGCCVAMSAGRGSLRHLFWQGQWWIARELLRRLFLARILLVLCRRPQLSRRAQPSSPVMQPYTDVADGALDMTPPFMYHAIAWVWMEFLSVGLDAAEDAMSKCLELAQRSTTPTGSGEASGVPAESSSSSSNFGIGGTSTGESITSSETSILNMVRALFFAFYCKYSLHQLVHIGSLCRGDLCLPNQTDG